MVESPLSHGGVWVGWVGGCCLFLLFCLDFFAAGGVLSVDRVAWLALTLLDGLAYVP